MAFDAVKHKPLFQAVLHIVALERRIQAGEELDEAGLQHMREADALLEAQHPRTLLDVFAEHRRQGMPYRDPRPPSVVDLSGKAERERKGRGLPGVSVLGLSSNVRLDSDI